MSFNAKLFLSLIVLFAFSCGQKTKPKESTTASTIENGIDAANEQEAKQGGAEYTVKTIKFPCSPDIVKTKNYKGLFVQLTSICLNDTAVIDTLQKTENETILAQNSNYKHEVFLKAGGDSASYTITKDLVNLAGLANNEVLINPQMPKTAFEPKDNSVTIYFTFSSPNATMVKKVEFKVLLKGGIKFMGVVD